MNGVIQTATGDLLRAGFTTFIAGEGETLRSDAPSAPQRKYDPNFTQMHRWNGSAWVLVTQVELADEGENHIHGAKLEYASASSVTIGTATKISCVRDSDDDVLFEWTGQLTADLTVSGVGGLDTGSEAADTWYAVHIIADTEGAKVPVALLSLSATAPTLPSGYQVFRRIGWIRNDSSSAILKFTQSGSRASRKIHYDITVTDLKLLAGGTAPTWTDLDLSSLMPPTSDVAICVIGIDTANAAEWAGVRKNGSSVAVPATIVKPGVVTSGVATSMWSNILTDGSQIVEYKMSADTAALDVSLIAYEDSL